MIGRVEQWLDRERDQLALWLPVALGSGIAAWFVIPVREGWMAFLLAVTGAMIIAAAFIPAGRLRRALVIFLLLAVIGCLLAWWRGESVAAPRLERPRIADFTARIETVEMLSARDLTRLTLMPAPEDGLPARVRVNVAHDKMPPGIKPGMVVHVRARLMPPAPASLPGAYDFERLAWFRQLGASGTAMEPVRIVAGEDAIGFWNWINRARAGLTQHIQQAVRGSAGGIAAALVTGDQGGIAEEDAEAMRTSGLAHLLSISGLHVGAVVAGTMWIVLRMLALSPAMALRAPLPLVAAATAALAGIAYTLIAGAEIPTIRSCIAAMLVLIALAIGREAMTLRLVAAGAFFVLILWPEALVSPSFQLSFSAVTALVTLHQHRRVQELGRRREEDGLAMRALRFLLVLLITGLAIEAVLAPIALYHFHRAGIYGSAANMIAIPLTTFIIMPVEALALLLDLVGLGAPFWWIAEASLNLLVGMAHYVASQPGSVARLPSMPIPAFAIMVAAGLWLCLWQTTLRWFALPVFAAGAVWAATSSYPDLLITGDGRHVSVRDDRGALFLLRSRTGDYVREMIGTAAGDSDFQAFEKMRRVRCNADLCIADIGSGEQRLRVLATRSPYLVPWRQMVEACNAADIVVSDRRLPRGCAPRWLKADRELLRRTGGIALRLDPFSIETVRRQRDDHPWLRVSPESYRR